MGRKQQPENVCSLCFRRHQKTKSKSHQTGDLTNNASSDPQTLLEQVTLCFRCKPILSIASTTKQELEETEKNVRRLQLELIRELEKLQEHVSCFKAWKLSVDHMVQVSKSGSLDGKILLDHGSKGSNGRRRLELVKNREKIIKIIDDFQLFRRLVEWKSAEPSVRRKTHIHERSPSPATLSKRRRGNLTPPPSSSPNINELREETVEGGGGEDEAPEVNVEPLEEPDDSEPPPEIGNVLPESEMEHEFNDELPVSDFNKESAKITQVNGITYVLPALAKDPLAEPGTTSSDFTECEVCGKWIKRSQYLLHRRIHTGERTYRCKFCSKDFVQWGNLACHWKTQHPSHKPYSCDHCPEQFFWKGGPTSSRSKSARTETYISSGPPHLLLSSSAKLAGKWIMEECFVTHLELHSTESAGM